MGTSSVGRGKVDQCVAWVTLLSDGRGEQGEPGGFASLPLNTLLQLVIDMLEDPSISDLH